MVGSGASSTPTAISSESIRSGATRSIRCGGTATRAASTVTSISENSAPAPRAGRRALRSSRPSLFPVDQLALLGVHLLAQPRSVAEIAHALRTAVGEVL